MKYSCQVTINLPRDAVVALFKNLEFRHVWQNGLTQIETVQGSPFEVNCVSHLHFMMKSKEMVIKETILEQHLPDYISAMYVSRGVENISTDEFVSNANHTTTYISEQEFYSNRLFYRLLLVFMPSMFKKETQKTLDAFKAFCEGHDLDHE